MGESLGTIGDIGCYSFQANKILSTGEGGAVVTDNERLYNKARTYHDQGGVRIGASFPTWDHEDAFFGENFRMSELTAAIGIAQLKKIPLMLDKVRSLKRQLRESLMELNLFYRTCWDQNGDCGIADCFFIEDLQIRNNFLDNMKKIGLNIHGYYNSAVYENRLFYDLEFPNSQVTYRKGICPRAELLARQAVWIPISPLYSVEDIFYISDILMKCL